MSNKQLFAIRDFTIIEQMLEMREQASAKLDQMKAACVKRPPPQPINISGVPSSSASIKGATVYETTPRGKEASLDVPPGSIIRGR